MPLCRQRGRPRQPSKGFRTSKRLCSQVPPHGSSSYTTIKSESKANGRQEGARGGWVEELSKACGNSQLRIRKWTRYFRRIKKRSEMKRKARRVWECLGEEEKESWEWNEKLVPLATHVPQDHRRRTRPIRSSQMALPMARCKVCGSISAA